MKANDLDRQSDEAESAAFDIERQPRRPVRVDLDDLAQAFDRSPEDPPHYLDLQTGELAWVTEDTRYELSRIYNELGREGDEVEVAELEAALERCQAASWDVEAVLEAHRIDCGFVDRYLEVPRDETGEAYADMEEFIATVADQRLQDRLGRAISGRGAFRYFKGVLLDYPDERERWFAFKNERVHKRVLEWLEDEGLEPNTEPPPPARAPGQGGQ